MFNLNICFECTYRCRLPRPLFSKTMLKIHQANQKTNPSWSRFIDQVLDQRFKENSHDPKGIIAKNYDPKGPEL